MGHTTKSARFTGVLALLVIGGLAGLSGTGVSVDSARLPAQGDITDYPGIKRAQATAKSPALPGATLVVVPVSDGTGHHDVITGIPFEPAIDQVPSERPVEPGAESFVEIPRVVSETGTIGW